MTTLGAALRAAAVGGFRALPPRWRERAKRALGALGHEPGWAQALRARRLAETTKRLDRWAPETARLLGLAGIEGLEGRTCLEFGSGHLLTEPLLYHLAGAKEVWAVDHFAILDEAALGVVAAGIDPEAVVTALAPFAAASDIRRRLDGLLERRDWSLAGLAGLGLRYAAPFDVARTDWPDSRFDLVASCSVLEHVPAPSAGTILAGLARLLRPGGVMVHAIHLEDHRDMVGAPFAFLGADDDWRDRDSDTRGNRLRASDWLGLFAQVPGLEIATADRMVRDWPLPRLAEPFAGYAPDDLRTKSLTVAARRLGGTADA